MSISIKTPSEDATKISNDPAHWYIVHTRNSCGCERGKPNAKCDIGVALWNLTLKLEAA